MGEVDVSKLLSTRFPALSDCEPTDGSAKDIFDGSVVASAELLLRSIVKTATGTLVANPMSPGLPMSFLLKLPIYAQLVMVLTNVVEATWYQEGLPDCPIAINLYASLLDDFDTNHPAADSDPDGIKVCVFANAFHSLQALKEDGALNADGSPLDMAFVDKEH